MGSFANTVLFACHFRNYACVVCTSLGITGIIFCHTSIPVNEDRKYVFPGKGDTIRLGVRDWARQYLSITSRVIMYPVAYQVKFNQYYDLA